MNKNKNCDWMRYMNRRAGIPINRKRETPAPQGACDPLQIPGQ